MVVSPETFALLVADHEYVADMFEVKATANGRELQLVTPTGSMTGKGFTVTVWVQVDAHVVKGNKVAEFNGVAVKETVKVMGAFVVLLNVIFGLTAVVDDMELVPPAGLVTVQT